MASIVKRKNKYSVVYAYTDEHGNKRRKRETFDTNADARRCKHESDGQVLRLALNLAFTCSLRMGETLGLTWDCVDARDESIKSGNAYLFVNKESRRVNREALETPGEKGAIFKFPAVMARTNTALVLKEPKTKTSTRKVFITTTKTKQYQLKYRGNIAEKSLSGFHPYSVCPANFQLIGSLKTPSLPYQVKGLFPNPFRIASSPEP